MTFMDTTLPYECDRPWLTAIKLIEPVDGFSAAELRVRFSIALMDQRRYRQAIAMLVKALDFYALDGSNEGVALELLRLCLQSIGMLKACHVGKRKWFVRATWRNHWIAWRSQTFPIWESAKGGAR